MRLRRKTMSALMKLRKRQRRPAIQVLNKTMIKKKTRNIQNLGKPYVNRERGNKVRVAPCTRTQVGNELSLPPPVPVDTRTCEVCCKPATVICDICGKLFSCGDSHFYKRKVYHDLHDCYPLKKVYDPDLGVHVVAAKAITTGTIILKEFPILTLVNLSTYLYRQKSGEVERSDVSTPCLGCGQPNAVHSCKVCSLMLCSENCSKLKQHSEWECQYILKYHKSRKLSLKTILGSNIPNIFEYLLDIMMLRMLLLHRKDKDNYQEVMKLVHHPRVDFFMRRTVTFPNLASSIKSWAVLSTTVTSKSPLLWRVMAITLVLPTHMTSSRSYTSHLYPILTCWMTHSCIPNTDFYVSSVDDEVVLVASTDILPNTLIEVNLWSIDLFTTSQRQTFLLNSYILCSCRRCGDPRELDSAICALICLKLTHNGDRCRGLCYPQGSNDEDWKCESCGGTFEKAHADFSSIMLECPAFNIGNLEEILNHFRYIQGTCPLNHSRNLRLHVLLVEWIGNTVFMCNNADFGRLRMNLLYESTKILLNSFELLRHPFHHHTAITQLLFVVSEYYLTKGQLVKVFGGNWHLFTPLPKSWFLKLDHCRRVFNAYVSIPKFSELLSYVTTVMSKCMKLAIDYEEVQKKCLESAKRQGSSSGSSSMST